MMSKGANIDLFYRISLFYIDFVKQINFKDINQEIKFYKILAK